MAATTDATTDVTMDVITDAVYSAETAATACAGLLFSSYSAVVETMVHLVHLTMVVAATMAMTTTAAVPLSGSSYYPASAEMAAFSKITSQK